MRAFRANVLPLMLLVALLALSLGVPASAEPSADSDFTRVKAVFIGAIPADINTWAQQRGGTVVLKSDTLRLVAVQLAEGVNGDQFLADLRARPDVSQASYDAKAHTQHVRNPLIPNPPNDPRWGTQYGPPLIGLGISGALNDGWDYEAGSSTVIVAILDTGVDQVHEDLLNPCTPHCSQAGYDIFGHGTHVAGIVAAEANNSKGIAGVGQVKLMAVKALSDVGAGWWSQVAAAIVESAGVGAKVLNMSLGGGCFLLSVYVCYDVEEAVRIAHDVFGSVLVAASGNNGCVGPGCVLYPARYSRVLAVGSVTSTKSRSFFSNGGPELDLVAPGSSVLSTCPTAGALICGPGYDTLSGTSMAAPHVSGVAALVFSHCPTKTNTEVESLLRSTSEDLGAVGFDDSYGYGLVRADTAIVQAC